MMWRNVLRWFGLTVVVSLALNGSALAQEVLDEPATNSIWLPIAAIENAVAEFEYVGAVGDVDEEPARAATYVDQALRNGDFEQGAVDWSYYDPACIRFLALEGGDNNGFARVDVNRSCSNMQLYQPGISLEGGGTYHLSFLAASSSGNDIAVYLHQHVAPYTNYGLQQTCDLPIGTAASGMTRCDFLFSAPNIGAINNARLRFWFVGLARPGDVYFIDDVKLSGGVPEHIPDPVPPENLIRNTQFSLGIQGWNAYDPSCMHFYMVGTPSGFGAVGKVDVSKNCSNMQIYQYGIGLDPNTTYELKFMVTSSTNSPAGTATPSPDIGVYLHAHDSPYTNYGVSEASVGLPSSGGNWVSFSKVFTTPNTGAPITNARLRLWIAPYAQPGSTYWLDNFSLQKVG